jgi:predicted dehydrogenase
MLHNKQVRWGILGAGRIANDFCTAVNFCNNSIVYAVASRSEETGKAFALKFNATKYYNNYTALVNDPDIDVIYIATPHPFHYQQTILCLEHYKPVLCEKPMAMNYEQASTMIELATKNKVFLMEGMWTSCMPFISQIKQIIANGLIGAVDYLNASLCFRAPLNYEDRLYNKSLGGGSVLDVGVYVLSLATNLLGEPTLMKSQVKRTPTHVDATANMILQYPNGAMAHLISSIALNTPQNASIVGTKGRIYVKPPFLNATQFTLIDNEGNESNYHYPHLCNGFEYEVQEVYHCLQNGLLESSLHTHKQTLIVSKLMDEVLKEAGISYN